MAFLNTVRNLKLSTRGQASPVTDVPEAPDKILIDLFALDDTGRPTRPVTLNVKPLDRPLACAVACYANGQRLRDYGTSGRVVASGGSGEAA